MQMMDVERHANRKVPGKGSRDKGDEFQPAQEVASTFMLGLLLHQCGIWTRFAGHRPVPKARLTIEMALFSRRGAIFESE
jgi:hypothetical protein